VDLIKKEEIVRMMNIKDEMGNVMDRICKYLEKCGYSEYRVRIGGDIMVDIGRPIPKENFTIIAEIANGHELSIAHGVDGDR
jgi:hypothetical protein